MRVPATTANLGPGFDCLGVALRIYNDVTVRRGGSKGGADSVGRAAGAAFFRAAGLRAFAFSWRAEGEVPRSRGLGSSVTVRLGLLHGLNRLAGSPLDGRALFALCAELEGHPDNAAPAAFGGFTICAGGAVQRHAVDAKLTFVLLVPDFEAPTEAARKVVPLRFPRAAVVNNLSHAAAIAGAFASRRYGLLRGMFADAMHQQQRARRVVPFLFDVIAAGERAGALGGWLSGSGSTIACATLRAPQAVARAMRRAYGPDDARLIITTADNRGVRIPPH